MNYESAKQLKDAGFPDNRKGYGPDFPNEQEINEENIHAPTLSELIEACGGVFEDLCLLGEGREFQWYCTTQEGERIYGSAPEEAVARLWLEINK